MVLQQKKLIIGNIGLLELMFAFFPIISGYQYPGLPMGTLWILLMDFIALSRRKKIIKDNLLFFLYAFIIFHELVVFFATGLSITHLNNIFSTIVCLSGVIIIPGALDFKKLVRSLYIVGFIACIGIIYHFILLLSGKWITPILLPFLPAPPITSRAFEEMGRPVSFFWEPASFVTFMMVLLFISIVKKEWPIMLFFFFCILLSTSTNGIILAPLMLAIYVLGSKAKIVSKLMVVVILVSMSLFFFSSSLFEQGIQKAEETEFSENVRLSNGVKLVSTMPLGDIILGISAPNTDNYINENYTELRGFHGDTRNFYISDFWYVLVVYGIIGLILHLSTYLKFTLSEKRLLPYVVVLLVAQFSQSISFRSLYVYQFIFIFSFIIWNKQRKNAVQEKF